MRPTIEPRAAIPSAFFIVGQIHSTLNIPHLMNSGRVLIVNLSKGRLGEAPSHLLGALLVSAIAQAAEGPATIPERERRDFTLYADEFQNFATENFATILSEARKWRFRNLSSLGVSRVCTYCAFGSV